MSAAADRLYAIVRQLSDENYRSPDPPDEQDMIDAVIAYEAERKLTGEAGNVPSPHVARSPLRDDAFRLSRLLLIALADLTGRKAGRLTPDQLRSFLDDCDSALAKLGLERAK
jgi:hypothetical protein